MVVVPIQAVCVPPIKATLLLTVTCDTLKHVLPIRYVIFTVPPLTPDTKPVRVLTVAVVALEVLQVPPALALASMVL